MQKETIVQLVGYVTALDSDAFAASWEKIAGKQISQNIQTILQQTGSKARHRYISLHEGVSNGLSESFVAKRRPDGPKEHAVKLVALGGYTQLGSTGVLSGKGDINVMAFIGEGETDLSFYHQTDLHTSVTVYEAYYESATFAYVLAYMVAPSNCAALVQYLEKHPGNEVATYIDCPVPPTR